MGNKFIKKASCEMYDNDYWKVAFYFNMSEN